MPQFSPIQHLKISPLLRLLTLGLISTLIAENLADSVQAQITPDNTLGNENSVVSPLQTIRGIPSNLIEGGAVRGENLFHSFQEFNIPEGYGAYFANPANIINIFSRVTGGNISQILGKLGVLGNSNLFLINPNGIIFGSNASLDLAGSFVGSTANSIIFNNNFEFSATNPAAVPLLSINIPIGLQTGANPQDIIVRSQAENSEGVRVGLQIQPNQTIALIGGNIRFEGGIITAEGGQIELGSIAGNNLININFDNGLTLDYSKVSRFQDITLSQGSILDVDGLENGGIQIQGQNLLVTDGSEIDADNSTANPGKDVTITTSESVELVGSGGSNGDSMIAIAPFAEGDGGNLNIATQRLTIRDGAFILGNVDENATGRGGNITINATELIELKGQTSDKFFASDIQAGTLSTSPLGEAGNITIVTQRLIIQDGGRITTSVARGSAANAGTINIKASKSVDLRGTFQGGTFSGGLFSQSNPNATGDAGTLTVDTQRLSVTDGAQMSISTQSSGNGGKMIVNAGELVEVRGGGFRDDGSRFNSGLFSSVGRQDINSTGKGGDITINTPKLVVDEAPITANTFSRGDGGSITLNVEELTLKNGGQVGVETFGEGNGGTLTVNASQSIEISGSGLLFTPIGQTNIPIVNSSLLAASEGTGNAGNINVNAENIFLNNGSTISASTANGEGGNITINLNNSLFLSNGSSITATAGTANAGGDGGNIRLTAPYIIAISNDNNDISANAFTGNGGNIQITAEVLLGIEPRNQPTSFNDITASSEFGTSGIVQINNPNIRPNIELAKAEINPVDISALISQNVCTKGSQSEFIITGRGGLPPNPTAPLSPKILWEDLGQSTVASHNSSHHSPIVEANQWNFDSTGKITFIASNVTDTETLLKQAQDFYQNEQFKEALNLWQNAANVFKTRGDHLNYARVLSYLALADQKLGQWQESRQSLIDSLQILNNNLSNPNSFPILAGALNNLGNLELELGQNISALESFNKSEKFYQQVGNVEGKINSILNQAYALQTLGLNRQALQLLYPLYQNQKQQPDSLIKTKVYRSFGEALQLVGNLELAETVLQESLLMAQKNQANSEIGAIYLNLGNLSRIHQDSLSLSYYQKAFDIASNTIKLQAQLNQLSYFIEQQEFLKGIEIIPSIEKEITNLSPSQSKIYAEINLAKSLSQLVQNSSNLTFDYTDIIQRLNTSLQIARQLEDKRAEAYILGYIGSFYQQNQQFYQAEKLSQQALFISESIQAEDIAYLWQWQLGQIFKAQGKQTEAIAFYTQAYNTLEKLRQDLGGSQPNVEFSFRKTIEPIYRQLVELLLQKNPSQANLIQARNVIESLQIAELNNFFQDACTEAKPQQIDQIDRKSAIIYSIILPNSLEIILSLAQQPLKHYSVPVKKDELEQTYQQFLLSLNPYIVSGNPLKPKQQLYDWLIRSIEQDLKGGQIKTIVTVLDGVLRGIPLAALHDGKQYLVEKYDLALTPGLQLLESQHSSFENLKSLVAGLTEARQGFSALPGVKQEVEEISEIIPTQILLDKNFTRSGLEKKLEQNSYLLVHLATHGQFSSEEKKTFLLTWDGQININELKSLLQRKTSLEPIELLILSACQTATGDNKAALGLAGVAVRSGARSTLATLWSVEDQSTALLMKEFYKSLSQPGMTKAAALRQAQLILLHSSDYQHPYYWAPFVLIGNWL